MKPAPHLEENGTIGFDEQHQRIAVCWPNHDELDGPDELDIRRARQETIVRLLQWLTSDNRRAKGVGQKAIVAAWLIQPIGTQRDLACRLGLTEARVSQLVGEVRRDLSFTHR